MSEMRPVSRLQLPEWLSARVLLPESFTPVVRPALAPSAFRSRTKSLVLRQFLLYCALPGLASPCVDSPQKYDQVSRANTAPHPRPLAPRTREGGVFAVILYNAPPSFLGEGIGVGANGHSKSHYLLDSTETQRVA